MHYVSIRNLERCNFDTIVFYSIDSASVPMQAEYTSNLTTSSPKYSRNCIELNYFYQALEVNVVEDGFYTFGSRSKINTYGYFYEGKFNPFDPSMNAIQQDDDGGCSEQFKLTAYLRKQTTYTLIVTTYNPIVTGSFSILVLGSNNVTLTDKGEYSVR